MNIRAENEGDKPKVYQLNCLAFPSDAEAKLVDALRNNVSDVISLVAVDAGEIVGHIMFSPISIDGGEKVKMYGLAPMAVTPKLQKRGVGSSLVSAGLASCISKGVGAVFVLGHANYYPRFGFEAATKFGITSEYDVPEEVFMCKELVPGVLSSVKGVVKFSSEFGGV